MKVPVADFKATMTESEYVWLMAYFFTETLAGHPLLYPGKPNCSQCGVPHGAYTCADENGWEIIFDADGREFWAAFDTQGALIECRWLDEVNSTTRALIGMPFLGEDRAHLTAYVRADECMLLCRHCRRPAEVAS